MKKRRAGKKKENRSRSTGSPTSANPSCVPFNSINAYPATITCFFFTHKNIPWNAFSHRPYINLDKSTSADHMSADFVFFLPGSCLKSILVFFRRRRRAHRWDEKPLRNARRCSLWPERVGEKALKHTKSLIARVYTHAHTRQHTHTRRHWQQQQKFSMGEKRNTHSALKQMFKKK